MAYFVDTSERVEQLRWRGDGRLGSKIRPHVIGILRAGARVSFASRRLPAFRSLGVFAAASQHDGRWGMQSVW